MILLDTHTWLWLRSDPSKISKHARSVIASTDLGVSAISCWEIATLVRRGKIKLDRDVDVWIARAISEAPAITLVDVTHDIATQAGNLDDSFPGDPADRIIFATSAVQRCPLMTKDRRLRAYSPDQTIWD